MSTRLLLPTLVTLVLASCAMGVADSSPSSNPDAGGSADAGGSPDAIPANPSPTPPSDGQCFAGEKAVEVNINPGYLPTCAAWPTLNDLSGTAVVTRVGDTLTIDFGNGNVYSGTIQGNQVDLVYTHQHPWSDDCTWQATETLSGTINDDCSMTLDYEYVESVVVSDGTCDTPCDGDADVDISITPIE